MATCDMGYEHNDAAPAPADEPAPVIVDPGPNEHDVEIAQIEAAASVEREKIYALEADQDLVAENERLRGKIAGMEEILARLQPPESAPPAPVEIPMPAPAPAPDAAPPPPEGDKPKPENNDGGWWAGYR